MKCPSCNVELGRTSYEDVPVFECPECGGYLVSRSRMPVIRALRGRSAEDLEAEAESRPVTDATEVIHCPKCRVRHMEKRRMEGEADRDFLVDTCKECDVLWFQGGELARMQMHYEHSPQGIEALARQQRAAALATDNNDEFERNVAALPNRQTWLLQAGIETVLAAVAGVLVILSIMAAAFDFPFVAAVVSLLAAALLARQIMMGMSETWAKVWLAAIAVGEAAFLGWLWLDR